MPPLNGESTRGRKRRGPAGSRAEYAAWLEFLEATGAPPEGVPLPGGDAAEALLRQIGLDEPDLGVILAELPTPGAQPGAVVAH